MRGARSRPGGIAWFFVSAVVACVASGAAIAQCTPKLPISAGDIPCYIMIQPIDVCGTSGTSTCAPFNTISTTGVGVPGTAGMPFSMGLPNNPISPNPIGFVVNPSTGVVIPAAQNPPQSGGVDITQALLNQLGVNVVWLPMTLYNSAINPATGATFQTLNVTQTTNPATGEIILDSADFRLLSQQVPSTPPAAPTAISQGATPTPPRSSNPTTVNLFFVNKLNPPTQQAGGTLYGFSWIGNNGVAIAANTFGYPRSRTSLPPRPDTISHELSHDLGLDHPIFGAGPYNPWNMTTNPQGGVVALFPANPLLMECDPSYPACGRNLMTAGNLRTEPTVGCLLAPANTSLSTCFSNGVQVPTLANGLADQVTTPTVPGDMTMQLPVSQQREVLSSGSGLLHSMTSGLLNSIPYETTKAQTRMGASATDPIIFDLSGPTGGKPGETLVAWVLTLPPGETFARHDRFRVVSQSRKDLVRDVNYYPNTGNNPLMRNIAYYPGADNNWADSSIGAAADSPCASATAECVMVKFREPGLRAHDSISFSEGILKSILFSRGVLSGGGAPITNDDLCKAKITYMFSDGYATTSNLGHCPASSLPLIASSWRPDPAVPPQIMKPDKTNLLLAQMQTSAPSGAVVMGSAYLNNAAAGNAVIGFSHGMPDVTFSVPSPNPFCPGAFAGGALCFNSDAAGNGYTLGGFLTAGGATILTGTAAALASSLDNTVFEFTGTVTVTHGETFQLNHDDGLQLLIGSLPLVIDAPGPAAATPVPVTYTYTGPSGTFPFDLVYGECCGPPAVLNMSLPLASQIASMPCTPDPNNPGQCMSLILADADPSREGGQVGQSCNNGPINGTVSGNVTVSAPQNCVYTSPCEITGNLTINGGSVYLDCALDGNLTENGGTLVLGPSASVGGNVQISQASSFTLGQPGTPNPTALIRGNLVIQNLPNTVPQQGTVCGTHVLGYLLAQSNASPVTIGGSSSCNNLVKGNLQVFNNNAATVVSFNTITGYLQCQGNNPVPKSGSNTANGQPQAPCAQ